MPGVRRPGPLAGLAAALPGHWARAHAGRSAAGQDCLHRKGRLLLGPGLTDGRRQRAGAAAGCARGGARTSRAPHRVVPRDSPTWGAEKKFSPADRAPGPALHAACGRLLAGQSFSAPPAARLTWEAGHERAEPEQAGIQGRRGPRHGAGARPQRRRGRRAPRGPRAGAGARGPRAGGRSHMPGSQRPRPGGRRWRLRWPAPRRHHPSRSARRRVPGLPGGVAARDCPGGRLWAREGRAPRWGRDFGSGTRHHSLPSASAPSLPPSGPPGSTFLPPLSSPSPPSKPPPGCHTVSLRRGGAGRGELRARPAPPRAGTRLGRGARGAQVEVPSGALAGGPSLEGGSRRAFLAAGRHGEREGYAPLYFGLPDRSGQSRYGEILRRPAGSPKVTPRAAHWPEERRRRRPV